MRKLLTVFCLTEAMLPALGHAQPPRPQYDGWVCAVEQFVTPCPDEYPVQRRVAAGAYCFTADGQDYVRHTPTMATPPQWVNLDAAISTRTRIGASGTYIFPDAERILEVVQNVRCGG